MTKLRRLAMSASMSSAARMGARPTPHEPLAAKRFTVSPERGDPDERRGLLAVQAAELLRFIKEHGQNRRRVDEDVRGHQPDSASRPPRAVQQLCSNRVGKTADQDRSGQNRYQQIFGREP